MNDSLALVAIVVIGGMGSVTGAVIGAIWVIGIPAFAPNNQVIGLLASSLGLLVVLLYFPRGLNQIAFDRPRRHRRLDRSPAWPPDHTRGAAYPAAVRRAPSTGQFRRSPTLAVSDLSV